MRTKIIYSLAIIGLVGFGVVAMAQEVSPLPLVSATPSLTVSLTVMPITPTLKFISDKELKQEMQIKEINGWKVCKQYKNCPFEDLEKSYIEVIIKVGAIKEISSDSIIVSIFSQNYKIDFSEAKLLRQSWGNSNLDEFSVGDLVTVFGYLDDNDETLVHAKTVRNLSIQKSHIIVKGIVQEIGNNSFVVKVSDNDKVQILVGEETKIIKTSLGTCIQMVGTKCSTNNSYETDFSVIKVGEPIIVRGMIDKQVDVIQADSIIIGNDNRPFFKNIEQSQQQLQTGSNSLIDKLTEKIDEKTGFKEKVQELQNRIIDMMQQVKSKEGKV
jgi:hypothetical protein